MGKTVSMKYLASLVYRLSLNRLPKQVQLNPTVHTLKLREKSVQRNEAEVAKSKFRPTYFCVVQVQFESNQSCLGFMDFFPFLYFFVALSHAHQHKRCAQQPKN